MIDPDYGLFADIVAAGSISAAARQAHLSQAMVSKRLARLEQRLGVQLLHRTTRKMALTMAGERFHHDVLGILAAIRDAEERLAGLGATPAGPLRVSAPTSFGRLHIAPHLGYFLEAFPKVELDIDLSDGFVDLATERVDLAIRIGQTAGSGLVSHRLGHSTRLLCAASSYVARYGAPATINDLVSHRLLAANGQLPWRLDGPDGPVLFEGQSLIRTNSSEIVRELALTGTGIALRSMWDVDRDIAAGRLIRVLPDYGAADVGIHAVRLQGQHPRPAITAFIDFLRDTFARHLTTM